MPIVPTTPFPKSPGDQIRSGDWNQAVNEVIRLDNAKVNRTGDNINGNLSVSSNLSVGGASSFTGSLAINGSAALNGGASVGNIGGAPQTTLHVAGGNWDTANSEGDLKIGNATHRLKIGVALDGAGAGDVRISAQGGTNRLMLSGGTSDVLTITGTGIGIHDIAPAIALNVNGDAQIGPTNGGANRLTIYGPFNSTPPADGALVVRQGASTLYLRLDQNEVDCTGQLFLNFWSAQRVQVGSNLTTPGGMIVFGNLHATGNITAGGTKTGCVVDNFINSSGETLEEGDVVVLHGDPASTFYGENDLIPVPEVELTARPYDQRVCGIVAEVLVEEEPAFPAGAQQAMSRIDDETDEVDVDLDTGRPQLGRRSAPARRGGRVVRLTESRRVLDAARSAGIPMARARALQEFADNIKRLQVFRPEELGGLNRNQVANGLVGQMAILGCYAYCKVDADIAPVEVGDLLTTSPTRGHAQKVTEPQRAIGAIIGKAMGSLESGKGKIPILVMLQ